jgi:hypothetical protein
MSKDCIHSRSSSTTTISIEEQKKKKIERNAKKRVVKNICKNTKALPGRSFLSVGQTFQACEEA